MDSPAATPAPPPLHLLTPVTNSDVSSPCEQIMVRTRSVAVNTADVALATEPECLGPCEPGTSVNLEGIVWQETEDGEGAQERRSQAQHRPLPNPDVVCLKLLVFCCDLRGTQRQTVDTHSHSKASKANETAMRV